MLNVDVFYHTVKQASNVVLIGTIYLFFRLDDLDSRLSSSSDTGVRRCGLNIEGLTRNGPSRDTSFKKGMRKGSEGLKSIGRSLGFGVSRAVFPEDLKVSDKNIFDPQDKFLVFWNRLFVISCILAVSVDPLFFYLPVINNSSNCLGIDRKLAVIATTLRMIVDAFFLIHMALQFRTAYIAPSSRVFGRGELVIDPARIAKRYLRGYFIIDFLSVLPLPQVRLCYHESIYFRTVLYAGTSFLNFWRNQRIGNSQSFLNNCE